MIGISRWFDTMVATAMASTMIMPVAAEKPPMNTIRLSHCLPACMGRPSTNESGSLTDRPCSSPPAAMGMTNTLMSNMYSGNNHTAVRIWRSCEFSTTAMWNWRGRNWMADIARIR